jgi:hypothetical protein
VVDWNVTKGKGAWAGCFDRKRLSFSCQDINLILGLSYAPVFASTLIAFLIYALQRFNIVFLVIVLRTRCCLSLFVYTGPGTDPILGRFTLEGRCTGSARG